MPISLPQPKIQELMVQVCIYTSVLVWAPGPKLCLKKSVRAVLEISGMLKAAENCYLWDEEKWDLGEAF